MLFNPDIEKILRRPRIDKPQEEFILTNPPAQFPDQIQPEELLKSIESKPLALIEELNNEAASVQELINILLDTAEDITIEVPEEDQDTIGKKINTQDYIKAIDDLNKGENQYIANRTIDHFEYGVLQDPSTNNTNWALLALRDFQQNKQDLIDAIGVLEGSLLESTQLTSGGINWAQDAISSNLNQIHKGLIQSSIDFKFKFFNSVRSIHVDLASPFMTALIGPITRAEEIRLRKMLNGLAEQLRRLKDLLKAANLVRSFEYFQVRDALLATIKEAVAKQIVSTTTVMINRTRRAIIDPVINLFTEGFEDSGPLALIGDQISSQFASIIADSINVLLSQYTNLTAEFLRDLDKERRAKILKLQVLGERSVISRYISHIDVALALIDRTLKELNLTNEVANRLFKEATKNQDPLRTKLVEKLEERSDYQEMALQAFEVRNNLISSNTREDLGGNLFEQGETSQVEQVEATDPDFEE